MKNSSTMFVICVWILGNVVASSQGRSQTDALDNGCNITRWFGNDTAPKTPWFGMPLPHLDCAGTGQTRLDVEGVVSDTKSLTLSYNDMIELHVDDLHLLTALTKMEITSNKITRLVESKHDLILPFVYYLSLANNKLSSIPNDALKSFPNLSTLLIQSNQIKAIYNDDFRYNLKLTRLFFGSNPITTFQDNWMATLNISSLEARSCGLKSLSPHLANMEKLHFLDLSSNEMKDLPANSFSKCSALFWLDLASNKLTRIHEDAFKGAEQLMSLDLSDNLLETLAPNTFNYISKENLQIDLYENPFNCNCSMAGFKRWLDESRIGSDLEDKGHCFEDLNPVSPKLAMLPMFLNHISRMKSFDVSTGVRFKCMQPLRNHNKKFHQVSIDDFSCQDDDKKWTENCQQTVTSSSSTAQTTTTSTTTILAPNRPPSIKLTCPKLCTCFDENQKIFSPSIKPNPNKQYRTYWMRSDYPRTDCIETNFTSIPGDISNQVAMIALTGNNFKTLNIRQFRRFQSATILVLKYNKITALIADSDTILPKVKKLHLAFNSITSITKAQMKSFPNVESVSLYHNSITVIPGDLFGFNRKLKRLNLGPNPIAQFKEDFMKTLSLTRLSLRNMTLRTIPKSIGNLVNLSSVDLSDNLITTVKNTTFLKCKKLYRISLDNNRISVIEPNAFYGATTLNNIDLSENELKTLPATVFANVGEDRLSVDLWQNPFVCNCSMKGFKAWIEEAEDDNPLTEVRFNCEYPERMHDKKSNEVPSEQFVCKDGDVNEAVQSEKVQETCNISGKIALAVIASFLCTLLLCVVAWKCTFKRRYGELLTYAKQRNDYNDMEELQ